MNQAENIIPSDHPDAIFDRESQARALLERLEQELVDAGAEAERARLAFERTPAPSGLSAKEVAAQKAANARTALDAAREEHRPTLEAADEQRRQNAITSLRARIAESGAAFPATLAGLEAFIGECTRELRLRLDALHVDVRAYNELTKQLNMRERRRSEFSPVSVERMLHKLNASLAKTFGRGPDSPNGDPALGGGELNRFFRFGFLRNSHTTPGLIVELRQPCPPAWLQHNEGLG
jgi:hypothetical protein